MTSLADGWPKPESIPESTVVNIPADSSYHGSREGSRHGSRHGSVHGSVRSGQRYSHVLAAQAAAADGNQAAANQPLERQVSRRLSNAGSNDYAQDYAGDYPTERDREPPLDKVAKEHNYSPDHILHAYFRKWKGGIDDALPIPPVYDMIVSFIGAFLGILWVAGCAHALDDRLNEHLLVASLGATAVLIYGVMESKLAQPRNVIGGHVISAAVGAAFRLALKDALWLAAPLAMAVALLAMQLTRTVHPPGGATAIIASQATPIPPWAGFSFILVVLVASTGMTLIAILVNNVHLKKRYPTYWFGGKL